MAVRGSQWVLQCLQFGLFLPLHSQEAAVTPSEEGSEEGKEEWFNTTHFVFSENNYDTSMNDPDFEEPQSLIRKKRFVSLLRRMNSSEIV